MIKLAKYLYEGKEINYVMSYEGKEIKYLANFYLIGNILKL